MTLKNIELDTKKALTFSRKYFHKAYLLVAGYSEVRTLPRGTLHHQQERIQALVEWDERLDSSAGVDARGTYKAWQKLCSHNGSIKERTKKWHL